jgi:hypothetical protein
MFQGLSNKQTLSRGKLKVLEGSATIQHALPTKGGMSGTHIATKHSEPNSFQAIHSSSLDQVLLVHLFLKFKFGNGINGGVSTDNMAFAEQYKKHIVNGRVMLSIV